LYLIEGVEAFVSESGLIKAQLLQNGFNSITLDGLHVVGTFTPNNSPLVHQLEEFKEEGGPKTGAHTIDTTPKTGGNFKSLATRYSCGKRGHFQRDCRMKRKWNPKLERSKPMEQAVAGVCKLFL
jgi:hypothetical protein